MPRSTDSRIDSSITSQSRSQESEARRPPDRAIPSARRRQRRSGRSAFKLAAEGQLEACDRGPSESTCSRRSAGQDGQEKEALSLAPAISPHRSSSRSATNEQREVRTVEPVIKRRGTLASNPRHALALHGFPGKTNHPTMSASTTVFTMAEATIRRTSAATLPAFAGLNGHHNGHQLPASRLQRAIARLWPTTV